MVEKVTLGELKGMGLAGRDGGPSGPRFAPVPMFLPTETHGNNVVTVVTRQGFLDTNIGAWIKWRLTKVGAAALGVLAVILIPFNVYLAIIAGIGAGWVFGQYLWQDFYITQLLGKRRLLEST